MTIPFPMPSVGKVIYIDNKLYLSCLGNAGERVEFFLCDWNGNILFSNRMDERVRYRFWSFFTFEFDFSFLNLQSNHPYVVIFDIGGRDRESISICDFLYRPKLDTQYSNYPFTGDWLKLSEFSQGVIDLHNDIRTNYLGNKKLVMTYCTEVPDPNPRNLFIGCEDYVTEFIKKNESADWGSPLSEKIIYYWYDENQTLIKAGENSD